MPETNNTDRNRIKNNRDLLRQRAILDNAIRRGEALISASGKRLSYAETLDEIDRMDREASENISENNALDEEIVRATEELENEKQQLINDKPAFVEAEYEREMAYRQTADYLNTRTQTIEANRPVAEAERQRAEALRQEINSLKKPDSGKRAADYMDRYDTLGREIDNAEATGGNSLAGIGPLMMERADFMRDIDTMAETVKNIPDSDFASTDFTFAELLVAKQENDYYAALADNPAAPFDSVVFTVNEDGIDTQKEESIATVYDVLQRNGRITNEFSHADEFTKALAETAKRFDITKELRERAEQYRSYKQHVDEWNNQSFFTRAFSNDTDRPQIGSSADFMDNILIPKYINNFDNAAIIARSRYDGLMTALDGIIETYDDFYNSKEAELAESEKNLRFLTGTENEEDIKEQLAEDKYNSVINRIDARIRENNSVREDIAKANNDLDNFRENISRDKELRNRVLSTSEALFDQRTLDLIENAKFRLKSSITFHDTEQIITEEPDKAAQKALDLINSSDLTEEEKAQLREDAQKAARLEVNTAVDDFKVSKIQEVFPVNEKAVEDSFRDHLLRTTEIGMRHNKTEMEIYNDIDRKVDEIYDPNNSQDIDKPVYKDVRAASHEVVPDIIRASIDEGITRMANEMIERVGLSKEVARLNEEPPIQYGKYDVEAEAITEENALYGDRGNVRLKRENFRSDEKYLEALMNDLADKENIVAENERLAAEMQKDLDRLQERFEQFDKVNTRLHKMLNQAYDKKNAFDEKYQQARADLANVGKEDNAIGDVCYRTIESNDIRQYTIFRHAELREKMRNPDLPDNDSPRYKGKPLAKAAIDLVRADEIFRKRAEYVENDVKNGGAPSGHPYNVEYEGKQCNLIQLNNARKQLKYFREMDSKDKLREFGYSNICSDVVGVQKKETLDLDGGQDINPIAGLVHYKNVSDRRSAYCSFFKSLSEALNNPVSPYDFDRDAIVNLMNGKTIGYDGMIFPSDYPVSTAMRHIAYNAIHHPEAREYLKNMTGINELEQAGFDDVSVVSTKGMDTALNNYIKGLDDVMQNKYTAKKNQLEKNVADMEKYVESVNRYYAAKKEMDAYFYQNASTRANERYNVEIGQIKEVQDKLTQNEYYKAYNDISEKLTDLTVSGAGRDTQEKLINETIPDLKEEIQRVRDSIAKERMVKDIAYIDNLSDGKSPYVVDFNSVYNNPQLKGSDVLTGMLGSNLNGDDGVPDLNAAVDLMYINGMSAKDYYTKLSSPEKLSEIQIRERLENDLTSWLRESYGMEKASGNPLSGAVVSFKDEGVMRPITFEADYLKNIEPHTQPEKPSEPSKWFKSKESYRQQYEEYRQKMQEYEEYDKKYGFADRALKKGTPENAAYTKNMERIAKENAFAAKMCDNMNKIEMKNIEKRLSEDTLYYTEMEENKSNANNAPQNTNEMPTLVIRRTLNELTRVRSTGVANRGAAVSPKTPAVEPRQPEANGVTPK